VPKHESEGKLLSHLSLGNNSSGSRVVEPGAELGARGDVAGVTRGNPRRWFLNLETLKSYLEHSNPVFEGLRKREGSLRRPYPCNPHPNPI